MANVERNAEIIRRRNRGEFPTDIAKAMGISRNAVIGVCDRAGVHRHDSHLSFRALSRTILSPEKVRTIRAECQPFSRTNGCAALGRKYGVHGSTIEKIVNFQSWADIT